MSKEKFPRLRTTENKSSQRSCKSAWSMPRDNTSRRAIYAAYIRSPIHPNGPEAHCFHAALRRLMMSQRDGCRRKICMCMPMDVRRVARYNWLLIAVPIDARRHTRKIPISRNTTAAQRASICIAHASPPYVVSPSNS